MLKPVIAAATFFFSGLAHAQPELHVSARDVPNLSTFDLLTDTVPVLIEGRYGAVEYEASAVPGAGHASQTFLSGQLTVVRLLTRSMCDDYIITGSGEGPVNGQVRIRLAASASNRPSSSTITVQLILFGTTVQNFTLEQSGGDSNDDLVFVSNLNSFPVGTPFRISTSAEVTVGGVNTTQAHSATLTCGFEPGGAVLLLPEGYTLDSVCAGVAGNRYRIACQADVNGDGILDNGDIGTFISLFLAGNIAADFTGDGILDNGDIGAFVAAFLAGC